MMVLELGFVAWLYASNWTFRLPRAGSTFPSIRSPIAPSVPKILQSVNGSQAPETQSFKGSQGSASSMLPFHRWGS